MLIQILLNFFILINIKTNDKDNKQNAKKQDNINAQDKKKKIESHLNDLVNKITKQYDLGLNANIQKEILNELMVFYTKSEAFQIDELMQRKFNDYTRNLQNFQENIQGELGRCKDNMTEEDFQNAITLAQKTLEELNTSREQVSEKFKKNREKAVLDFINLINKKLNEKKYTINFFIEERKISGKNNKAFNIEISEQLDIFLSSQIKITSYKFKQIPDVSGFFNDSFSDDDI